jgi:hypothetical protein
MIEGGASSGDRGSILTSSDRSAHGRTKYAAVGFPEHERNLGSGPQQIAHNGRGGRRFSPMIFRRRWVSLTVIMVRDPFMRAKAV